MAHLGTVLLPERKGDRHGVITVHETTGCQLLAFVWCDRDRRHFIRACSSLANGTTVECTMSARRMTGNRHDAMGMPMLKGRLGANCPFKIGNGPF